MSPSEVIRAGWRIIVQWGGIQGTPGTSGGVVHGANLTAASQMIAGPGNDYSVVGNSPISFVKPDADWGVGDPICFYCINNPPINNNVTPVPFGTIPLILDGAQDYTPFGSNPALWYFRFTGTSLQQISRTNF